MGGDFEMIKLQSALLTGPGGEYELSSLRVTYALGDIGSASVTLALGQRLAPASGKASFKLTPASYKDTWTISVNKGEGGSEKVFTGYLMGIKEERMPSVTGTRMSVVLLFSGLGAMLRTINATAYKYWGANDSYMASTSRAPGAPAELQGTALDGLWWTILDSLDTTVTHPHKDMAAFLLDALAAAHKVATGQELSAKQVLDDCVVRGDPVKLAQLISDVDSTGGTIMDEFGDLLTKAYGSVDMLAGLQAVGQHFYLNLVPRKDGKLRLLPVLAWLKKDDFQLESKDIVGCSRTGAFDNAMQSADHVAVALPPEPEVSNLPERYAVWPTDTTDKPGKAKIITLPTWMTLRIKDLKDQEEAEDADEGTRVNDKGEGDSAGRSEKQKKVGELVAKVGFAAACGAQEAFDVMVRWDKFEYLDKVGYIVKMPQLHDPNNESSEYIGMVAGVTLSMEINPQGGRCALAMTVVSARTPDVNDALGLDEHPIYE